VNCYSVHLQSNQIFDYHPAARGEVIGLIFSMILEEPSQTVKNQFASTLERIAELHLIAMREHAAAIRDWFGYLNSFPLGISKRILTAFIPLVSISPAFYVNSLNEMQLMILGSSVDVLKKVVDIEKCGLQNFGDTWNVCIVINKTTRR
jgi:hypothetical protein